MRCCGEMEWRTVYHACFIYLRDVLSSNKSKPSCYYALNCSTNSGMKGDTDRAVGGLHRLVDVGRL